MGKLKQKYYRVNNILTHNAQYNLLIGERSNGKSYAVKEHSLRNAWNKQKETMIYLRRYAIDMKSTDVEQYFADAPISAITNGEYDIITCYRGKLYFSKVDADTNKILRGLCCGRAVALSSSEHLKSLAFPDIEDIIFEEFLTKGLYLTNEPDLLQDVVSTIARRRAVRVWCIGNTISRICPYFREWGLKNIPKMEQGTIDDYIFVTDQKDENGNEITVKIAVEYCANSGSNSKMFFGEHAKAITGGAWETHQQPHLLRPLSEYAMLHEILLEAYGFQFVIQLLCNADGGLILFVYPYTRNRDITRKMCDTFSDLPFVTRGFLNTNIEQKMLDLLKSGKVCFSDNLTGEDFNTIIDEYMRLCKI